MEFASFVIFFIIACTLSAVLLLISSLLGRKRKAIREMDVYESGVNPVGSATRQYDIKFYLFISSLILLLSSCLFEILFEFSARHKMIWKTVNLFFIVAFIIREYITNKKGLAC